MLLMEEEEDVQFDIIMTHDAEDIIHSDSLRWINYFARRYDMVQILGLALPTPPLELTHGVYRDEFTEFQMKDLRARQVLGGFIPSCGVGTGFRRGALEKLVAAHSKRIFEPACVTEDYENVCTRWVAPSFLCPCTGLSADGRHPGLLPSQVQGSRKAADALDYRNRAAILAEAWVARYVGPALLVLADRKGPVGNLVAALSNLFFLYGALTWLWSRHAHLP
jgi:adsorption protein B